MNPRLVLALGIFALLLQQSEFAANTNALNVCRPQVALAGLTDCAEMETALAEIHDIAVVNVTLSTYETYPGQDVFIQVAVKNQGDFTEEFNVTVYAYQSSKIVIDIYCVGSLGSSKEIVIPFLWRPITVSPGNCSIVAESSPVEGEANISNNTQMNNLWFLADSTSPIIGVPVQNPSSDQIWVYTDVHVRVNVIDMESGVSAVFLSWRVENNSAYDGVTWMNETMPELPELPGTYEGTINSYDYWSGTIIKYRIVGLDESGNAQVRDNAGMFYVYTIIPEFPSLLALATLMIAALLLSAFHTKKLTKACA